MGKFCIYCGVELDQKYIFCHNCGKQIKGSELPLSQSTTEASIETNKVAKVKAIPIEVTKTVQPAPMRKLKPIVPTSGKNTQKKPVKKSSKKKKLFIPILAFILIIVVIFVGLIDSFLSDYSSSDIAEEPVVTKNVESETLAYVEFAPEAVKGSGSKAINETPIPGIHLQAEEGALDQDRTFTVTYLSEKELGDIQENLTLYDIVPLVGIHLDSGMAPSDVFPETLQVDLDLEELNVPDYLSDYLCIIRTDSAGKSVVIPSTVSNGQIHYSTEHNDFFSLGITLHLLPAIGIGVPVGVGLMAVTYDSMVKDGILKDDLSINTKLMDAGFRYVTVPSGYTIYYPAYMERKNPEEVKRVSEEIMLLLKKHDFHISGHDIETRSVVKDQDLMMDLLKIVEEDEEIQEILDSIDNVKWKMDNLWPAEVSEVYKHIELADAYLFDPLGLEGRDFKKYSSMDIVVFDEWPGEAGLIAASINPISKQPYVHVNVEDAPNHKASTFKGWSDTLLPTIIHELFHTSQVRYLSMFSVDMASDLWFWEATAVTVEKQAREFFENNGTIGHDKMLISQQYINFCQKELAFPGGYSDKKDLQYQGYAYAMLIEYISEQFEERTGNVKESYLNLALMKYAELRDSRETLVRTTTSSNYGFEQLYNNFCQINMEEIINAIPEIKNKSYPLPPTVELTKANPVVLVDHNYETLSTVIRKIAAVDGSLDKDYSAKLVLRGKTGELMNVTDGFSMSTLSSENKSSRQLYEPSDMVSSMFDVEIGFGTIANNNSLYLQEVNYNMDEMINRSFELIAMYRPEKPGLSFNKLTEESWYLLIQYPKSILKDDKYVDSYKVSIRCPNGDVYSFITEENEIELPINYDKETIGDSINNMDNIRSVELVKADTDSEVTGDFDVIYRELTSSDAKVMGPQSIATNLVVDETVDLNANSSELFIDDKIFYTVDVTPDKGNYSYHWYIDKLLDQDGGRELQFTFKEAGTYTAIVTVKDIEGNSVGKDTWTCTVTESEPLSLDYSDLQIEMYQLVTDNEPTDYIYVFMEGYVVAGYWRDVLSVIDGFDYGSMEVIRGVYNFNIDTQTFHGDLGDEGTFTAEKDGNMLHIYDQEGNYFMSGRRLTDENPFQEKEKPNDQPSNESDGEYLDDTIFPDGDE